MEKLRQLHGLRIFSIYLDSKSMQKKKKKERGTDLDFAFGFGCFFFLQEQSRRLLKRGRTDAWASPQDARNLLWVCFGFLVFF